MLNLYILNIFNLPRFVFLVATRQRVCVLKVESAFGVIHVALQALVSRLQRAGRLNDGGALITEYRRRISVPVAANIFGAFPAARRWLESYYRFDDMPFDRLNGYGGAYRNTTGNHIRGMMLEAYLLTYLSNTTLEEPVRVIGLGSDSLAFQEACKGGPSAFAGPPRVECRWPINIFLLCVVLSYTIAKAIGVTRLSAPPPQPFFLAFDYVHDPRLLEIIDRLTDGKEEILLVFRNDESEQSLPDSMPAHHVVKRDQGVLSLSDLCTVIARVLADMPALFRQSVRLEPRHARDVFRLMHQRVVFRALFRRYQPRHFFCRDEYNSEHIIRSQELRRAGGESLGFAHGITTPERLHPIISYVDFDVFHICGEHQYRACYAQTWPPYMKVRAVGSMGMTQEYQARIDDPRPPNILYFHSVSTDEREMIEAMLTVARAFPDRKVFIKFKERHRQLGFYASEDMLTPDALPENVIIRDDYAYDLFFEAQYAVGPNNSTITAEAIQFGLATFVLDLLPEEANSYWNDFPEIQVTGAPQIIDRITALDSGDACYPTLSLDPVISLSGKDIGGLLKAALDESETSAESTSQGTSI
jgi:hypothetical protein